MASNTYILKAAIERVEQELAILQREIRSFEKFRETVRLASPNGETVECSETTRKLRSAYRMEVMTPTEYEATYGDSLSESLTHELGPTNAETLSSDAPFTQKRKRTLLMKTTDAVNRRERVLEVLSDEHDALTSFKPELQTIHTAIDELPPCSAKEVCFEKLYDVWEVYTQLKHRCDHLIDSRQRQLSDADHRMRIHDTTYGLCEYLYEDLPSQYPVLTSIATVAERITTNRTSVTSDLSVSPPKTD